MRTILIASFVVVLCACAAPSVTRVQPLVDGADAPYQRVLVVSLFKSYGARRDLEKALVRQLEARGIEAVSSSSMMKTTTPMTRQFYQGLVASEKVDSVLVTQLVTADLSAKAKDASPQATYNVWATNYFNVWSVELTEYVEPQLVELKQEIVLAAHMYSASTQQPVWAIETKTTIKRNYDERISLAQIDGEAQAIVKTMSTDGLLAE